jgi:hypothetical protein
MQKGFCITFYKTYMPVATSELSGGASIGVPGNCLQLMQRRFCSTFYKMYMPVATSELSSGASIGDLMSSWHLTLHYFLYIRRDGYYFVYL